MEMDLGEAREKLVEILDEKTTEYFHNMKLWFKNLISKEEFDSRALQLVPRKHIHAHNDFFLAILAKCQIRAKTTDYHEISRSNKMPKIVPSNFKPHYDASPLCPPPSDLAPECSLSAVEGYLPDFGMVAGRVYLSLWENRLTLNSHSDDIARLVYMAILHMLKDILQATISLRRSHVIDENGFSHLFGAKKPSRSRKKSDLIPLSTTVLPSFSKISPGDVIDAISMNKAVLPSNDLRTRFIAYLMNVKTDI